MYSFKLSQLDALFFPVDYTGRHVVVEQHNILNRHTPSQAQRSQRIQHTTTRSTDGVIDDVHVTTARVIVVFVQLKESA